jgi:long-chain acyl-CoA synthetase
VLVLRGPAPDGLPEALLAHCRERLAGYKCPRSFSFVPALPLSAAGKVLKAQLRASLRPGTA